MRNFFTFFILSAFCVASFSQVTVSVDPTVQYQEMAGFGTFGGMKVWWSGGPFYNSGWLDLVVDDLGATIHRDEYYPEGGGRYPGNANDQDATWDDQTPMLTALKSKVNGSGEEMKFIVTFWTAPRQWKSNNNHKDGGHVTSQYYDEFAEYCVHVVEDYASIGIELYAISLQNEPRFAQFYNSGVYEPDQLRDMIKEVGQKFDEENIETLIFGPEDMGSITVNNPWFTSIFGDEEAKEQLDIWAVHSYTDGVQADYGSADGWTAMYERCKENKKPLWMTETSGYDDNWPGGALDIAKSMFLALEYGNVSGWVFWISEIMNDGNPRKKFYTAKHYYRYIRPGAVHIESSSSSSDVLVSSYKHTDDGRISIVLINNASSQRTVSLDFGSATLPGSFTVYRTTSSQNCENIGSVSNNSFDLPGNSLTTLVYEGSNKGPSFTAPGDMVVLGSDGQQTINVTDIANAEGGQNISVNVVSSNTGVIPSPSVNYTSPNNAATVSFTPTSGQSGTVTLTIEVSDNGDDAGDLNVTRKEIEVKVLPFVNSAPTLNPVPDITAYIDDGQQMIELTGLTDGNDGSQEITVSPEASVAQALQVASIPDGNKIKFYYVPKLKGDIPVTLTIKDDGGTDLGGVDTKEITFTVAVLEGSGPDPVSVGETDNNMQVFPNPVSDILNICINDQISNGIVTISNISGQMVYQQLINGDKKIRSIDIQDYEPGVYILGVVSENHTRTVRFIKE
jgi:glucuronoarabinoxylan endo-1,4-beta-xylanase